MPPRDLGPSWRAATSLILPDVARQKHWLFSLAITRLITFNTQPIVDGHNSDGRMIFNDLVDFNQWIDGMRIKYGPCAQPDALFCSRRAYTRRPIKGRVLDNKELIWAIVSNSNWGSLAPMTFEKAFKWLDKFDAVPGVGSLTKYLLLANLCSVGAASQPSVQSMAKIIHKTTGNKQQTSTPGLHPVGIREVL